MAGSRQSSFGSRPDRIHICCDAWRQSTERVRLFPHHCRDVSLMKNLAASAFVTGEILVLGPAAMLRASCSLLSMLWQSPDSVWAALSTSQVCYHTQSKYGEHGRLMILSDCGRGKRSSAYYSSCFPDYHGSLAYLLCGRRAVRWCKTQLHQLRTLDSVLTCCDRLWYRQTMRRTCVEH